jgi:prolyl oligopeptidase
VAPGAATIAGVATLKYPEPPRVDQVDDFHGIPIADPYRTLEDTDDPASRAWIEAEQALTERFLANAPVRAEIRRRLAELWNVPRARAPWRRGRRWFQLRNTGLQDQDVLWSSDEPAGEGRVLLDPNVVDTEGTTALGAIDVSESGELVAVALSHAGSDWRRWRIRDASTGQDLPDRIDWSKFTEAAWTHDDAGFFYGRYDAPPSGSTYEAPNRDMQLRYHRLGTDAASDPIVFTSPDDPEWDFQPEVADGGRLLVVSIWRGTDPENRVYVGDLTQGPAEEVRIRPLLDAADAAYLHVETLDGTMYLWTDRGAPLGRVVAIDPESMAARGDEPPILRELVAEGRDAIEQVRIVGGRLAVLTLHDAHSRLSIHELTGAHVTDVELPGIGMIQEVAGQPDDDELYLTFTSFAAPVTVLAVRMADGAIREVTRADGGEALPWRPADFVTEQVFVTSPDGTQVPLFLSHRRDVEPDGDVPTLLYGYGGFHIPVGPMFKPEWLLWMERGGLLAVASLRGGAEYGKAWHDAGRLANKQNVFDDFAACARWLASSGWTRRERIAISGRSNGGLLVGASLTQNPDLFGAAIAEVGVMDMLRFHRFTIGWGWTSDYGSPDEPEQFGWLLAYSPLHNCRPAAYPPTLLTTGDHDDRVVPGHTMKFAATLQAAQRGEAPILVRIDTDAGHGEGKPVSKLIDERADVLTFLDMAVGTGRPTAGA